MASVSASIPPNPANETAMETTVGNAFLSSLPDECEHRTAWGSLQKNNACEESDLETVEHATDRLRGSDVVLPSSVDLAPFVARTPSNRRSRLDCDAHPVHPSCHTIHPSCHTNDKGKPTRDVCVIAWYPDVHRHLIHWTAHLQHWSAGTLMLAIFAR